MRKHEQPLARLIFGVDAVLLLSILGNLVRAMNGFPNPNCEINTNPKCLYIREIKMGVGKGKQGGVGFARILCFEHPNTWVGH